MNRKYSLKKNYDIKELLQKKQSVGNRNYVIYYDYMERKDPLIALSVSRKVGNAVERNYEKRVIREIIRPLLETIEHYKMLIVVKDKSTELSYTEKEENINYLIKKMKKQKETINETINEQNLK
ncbi:MAG TPA: ribonuclease P protein component [Acholeplasma sp.]|jgi:ribonuclease P protein component|nr:ribonuclease P protein component [Acholeplasma sp.]